MKFTITNGSVALTDSATAVDDVYLGGLLYENLPTMRTRVSTAAGSHWQNGLKFGDLGRLAYVDATAGLPAGTTYCNGLPVDLDGHLCISTDAPVLTQNGIPFVANGAVAAQVTP